MRIVIARNSSRKACSALDAALAIREGFRAVYPDADYVLLPVADGGRAPWTRWSLRPGGVA